MFLPHKDEVLGIYHQCRTVCSDLNAIERWLQPCSLIGVHVFLTFYLQKFIQNYAMMADPLIMLTVSSEKLKKDTEQLRDMERDFAFQYCSLWVASLKCRPGRHFEINPRTSLPLLDIFHA